MFEDLPSRPPLPLPPQLYYTILNYTIRARRVFEDLPSRPPLPFPPPKAPWPCLARPLLWRARPCPPAIRAMLDYTILYYTTLYYTILYYTTLYYTILYCNITTRGGFGFARRELFFLSVAKLGLSRRPSLPDRRTNMSIYPGLRPWTAALDCGYILQHAIL